MFKEISNLRQIPREPMRRWFCDEDLELIVWLDAGGRIIGFQLCYETDGNPKALTWHAKGGFLHSGIDDGEDRPGRYKATPILVPDGTFDKANSIRRFDRSSQGLPAQIAEFVKNKIAEYGTEEV